MENAGTLSSNEAPKLRAVQHIGIPVSDLDRTLEFYKELTGGELLFTNEHAPVRNFRKEWAYKIPICALPWLEIDNTILEFIEYRNPKGKDYDHANNDVGINHLAFEVEDITRSLQAFEG